MRRQDVAGVKIERRLVVNHEMVGLYMEYSNCLGPGFDQRKQWIDRLESCSHAVVRRVAALLDLESDDVIDTKKLPRGWQFVLMGADTPRSKLRADGFPGLGVTMPNLNMPRLLLGSRTVHYLADIEIGATVLRRSAIKSLDSKTSSLGPMAIATIEHAIYLKDDDKNEPALVEEQTYFLLSAHSARSKQVDTPVDENLISGDWVTTVVPDETMLFQYSALGFNSHRIHIDRQYAQNVEGFPDLVVNGGLSMLFMTEFLRREIGLQPSSMKVRHLTPLFCDRPITLVATRHREGLNIKAFDHRSVLAIDMEAKTNGI